MITSSELKKLEREAHAHGILAEQLTENAAAATCKILESKFDLRHFKLIIFCGSGNNGGDGLCLAYHLRNFHPIVIFVGDREKLSDVGQLNYSLIKKTIPIVTVKTVLDLEKISFQKHLKYLFIDALVGIGISGEIREPLKSVIVFFNNGDGVKVSLDLPSGLDPDTGCTTTPCVESDLIITYHDIKPGLVKYVAKTMVVDIGLPVRSHST